MQVPDDFKAELIMVRLSLFESVAEGHKKKGSKVSNEIDELCFMVLELQPCWVLARPITLFCTNGGEWFRVQRFKTQLCSARRPDSRLAQLFGMARCAELLRTTAKLPDRAKILSETAMQKFEVAGSRPVDDQRLATVLLEEDSELKLQQVIDCDNRADVK